MRPAVSPISFSASSWWVMNSSLINQAIERLGGGDFLFRDKAKQFLPVCLGLLFGPLYVKPQTLDPLIARWWGLRLLHATPRSLTTFLPWAGAVWMNLAQSAISAMRF